MAAGDPIPAWYSDPRVIALLRASSPPRADRGFVVFFTGLSGSGKTTLAGALASRLASLVPTRRVRLLDGDVVRTHLSKVRGHAEFGKAGGTGMASRRTHAIGASDSRSNRMLFLHDGFPRHPSRATSAFTPASTAPPPQGLGLSLADRVTHVSRMGWVAAELAAQGMCMCGQHGSGRETQLGTKFVMPS